MLDHHLREYIQTPACVDCQHSLQWSDKSHEAELSVTLTDFFWNKPPGDWSCHLPMSDTILRHSQDSFLDPFMDQERIQRQ